MSTIANIATRLRNSRLANDSFWALVGSALGKGLSFLAGVAIARLLGSELYGEYGTIKNTLMMIAIFSSLGLGYSATKFIAECMRTNDMQRIADTHRIAMLLTFAMSGVIALLLVIFAPHVALWIDAPHLDNTLRLSAIAIVFNAINTTQTGEMAGLGIYRRLAMNSAWAGIFTFASSVIGALYYGFDGAIVALIVSLIFNAIINHISIRRVLKTSGPSRGIDRAYMRSIVRFSIPIALQESLYAITHWISIFILIKLAGYAELGISQAAVQWYAVLLFIPGALRNVALSHLAATNNDHESNNRILRRLMLINFVSTATPAIVVLLLAGYIASWYGATFDGLSTVLCISVVTAIVSSMANVLTQMFIAHGRNWTIFTASLLRDGGAVIATYFAILNFGHGALCAACSMFAFHIVYFITMFVAYRKINISKQKHG